MTLRYKEGGVNRGLLVEEVTPLPLRGKGRGGRYRWTGGETTTRKWKTLRWRWTTS